MGLNRERLLQKDALFFLQLLLSMCDPKLLVVEDDPRIPFYTSVAKFTNSYANDIKDGLATTTMNSGLQLPSTTYTLTA